MSSVFVIAMSLGEFGASFIIARNSDWVTMPLLIDAWRAKPMKDPLSAPASNSIATVLMLITMGLFLAERFRSDRQGYVLMLTCEGLTKSFDKPSSKTSRSTWVPVR